jgi:hypothetical protein
MAKTIPLASSTIYNPSLPPEVVAYNRNDNISGGGAIISTTLSSSFPGDVVSMAGAASSTANTQQYSFLDTTSDAVVVEAAVSVAAAGAAKDDSSRSPPLSLSPPLHGPKKPTSTNHRLPHCTTSLEKKSACFWCTYEFTSPMCFIPKFELDSTVHAYGSFCSPECAAAYLMNESMDDSVKFERYQMLNQIYRPLYESTNKIFLAPKPFYTLEKFFGNMTIDEYRALCHQGHTPDGRTYSSTTSTNNSSSSSSTKARESFDATDLVYGSGTPPHRISVSLSGGCGGGDGAGGVGGSSLLTPPLPSRVSSSSGGPLTTTFSCGTDNIRFNGIGNYRVKRQDDVCAKPCKNKILREKFGY